MINIAINTNMPTKEMRRPILRNFLKHHISNDMNFIKEIHKILDFINNIDFYPTFNYISPDLENTNFYLAFKIHILLIHKNKAIV